MLTEIQVLEDPHPRARTYAAFDDDVETQARTLLRDFWITNETDLFARLYEITAPRLHEIARAIVRKIAVLLEPEDLVSAWLAKLFTDACRPPREIRSFFGLARTAMRHEALDALRHQERLSRRHLAYHASAPSEAPDPSWTLGAREQGEALRDDAIVFLHVVGACVGRLGDRARTVLLAREVEGLSYDALASEFALPRGQVGMILKRARTSLLRRIECALDVSS